MKKEYKIIFDKIGRQKYCDEFTIESEELSEAEVWAYNKANQYLISFDTSLTRLEQTRINNWTYDVYAGFHKVGIIHIEEVQKIIK